MGSISVVLVFRAQRELSPHFHFAEEGALAPSGTLKKLPYHSGGLTER